ncbi:cell wall-binding repeat-containing protein [Euzebya rosea]|uniref:cell wall-binding repeat-containing protein n=1 Tax=Euzebya rosea TaxID=2052804 RepID=UPI000D3E4C2C|nr:cell wall-binding repeat-containing protein [Euzebya rosea]
MRPSSVVLALTALLAALLPTPAPAAGEPSPDDPSSNLQDRWIVTSDHYPVDGDGHPRAAVEHRVEGVVVEWVEIRPAVFEATVVDGGYEPCMAPGTVLVTEMVPRSDRATTFDGLALDADCTQHHVELEMSDPSTDPFLTWDTPTGRMRLDHGNNDWVEVEHRVVGDWLLHDTDAPDSPPGRTVLRITGTSPTFTATIVEAEEGSCFVPGEVWWDGLVWGHGLIPGGAGQNRAWGMVDGFRLGAHEDCSQHAGGGSVGFFTFGGQLTMAAFPDPGGTGYMGFSRLAGGSPVDPPPPGDHTADPADHPDLAGDWRTTTGEIREVSIRWTGDPAEPFLGRLTTQGDPTCPPAHTDIWRVTEAVDDAVARGQVTLHRRTATGCELRGTVPAEITLLDDPADRELYIAYEDPDGISHLLRYVSDRRTTLRGGRDEQALAIGFLSATLSHLGFGGLDPTPPPGQRGAASSDLTLYVATDANFPDGLAVAGLAGRTRGLTVLVDPDDPDGNARLLELLAPSFAEVVVVGGEAVVPSSSLPSTGERGAPTGRIAGTNRFHTAQVLTEAGWLEGAGTVFVATGVNYPDALSGGAAAAVEGAPVLLVDGGRMPPETDAALRSLEPDEIVVLGGKSVIPDSMLAALTDYAPNVIRLAGPARQQTSVAVSTNRFHRGADAVLMASGDRFGEALIAASAAWAHAAPLLLVGDDVIAPSVLTELDRLGGTRLQLLAVEDTVDPAVYQEVAARFRGGPARTTR